MAFEHNLPSRIKSATFYALGDTIAGNEKNLAIILQTTVQPTPKDAKLSAVLYMLVAALKNEDFNIRAGAAYLFEVNFHSLTATTEMDLTYGNKVFY